MMASNSDRRVGDALTDSDSDLEEALDPNLLARLAAWFAEAPKPTTEKEQQNAYNEARGREKDRAAAAVDPVLYARLEEKGYYYSSLVEPLPPVGLAVDPTIARFDLQSWQINAVDEIVDYERPDDIRALVSQNAPQALLRDLHRPVRPLPRMYLHPTMIAAGGGHPHDMVSRLMTTSYQADMTDTLSPSHMMREDHAQLADILAQPWENSKPEQPTKMGSSIPDENDMLWFGAGGIDYDQ